MFGSFVNINNCSDFQRWTCLLSSGGGPAHAGPGLWWDAAGLRCGHQNGCYQSRLWQDSCHSPHLIWGVCYNALMQTQPTPPCFPRRLATHTSIPGQSRSSVPLLHQIDDLLSKTAYFHFLSHLSDLIRAQCFIFSNFYLNGPRPSYGLLKLYYGSWILIEYSGFHFNDCKDGGDGSAGIDVKWLHGKSKRLSPSVCVWFVSYLLDEYNKHCCSLRHLFTARS